MNTEIERLVRKTFSLNSDIKITSEDNIFDDLQADNFDLMQLASQIAKKYTITSCSPEDIYPLFLLSNEKCTAEFIKQKISSDFKHISSDIIAQYEYTKNKRVFFQIKVLEQYIDLKTYQNKIQWN
jgi:acyl carrier protein